MHRGWVKVWRKAMDSPVFKSPELWHLFSYCLMMADHEPYKAIFGGKQVDLPAGTFITGRYILAERLGVPPSTAWTRLTKCIEYGLIDTKSDNKRTVITVCNWDRYQGDSPRVSTAGPTSNRQPFDNHSTLPKEQENPSTEEKTIAPAGASGSPDPPADAGAEVASRIERNAPVHRFLDWYCQEYQKRGQVPYPVSWGKHGKMVKRWMATYTVEELQAMVGIWWEADDRFSEDAGYSLEALGAKLPALALALQRSGHVFRAT